MEHRGLRTERKAHKESKADWGFKVTMDLKATKEKEEFREPKEKADSKDLKANKDDKEFKVR